MYLYTDLSIGLNAIEKIEFLCPFKIAYYSKVIAFHNIIKPS
jgi:hypothetical protein